MIIVFYSAQIRKCIRSIRSIEHSDMSFISFEMQSTLDLKKIASKKNISAFVLVCEPDFSHLDDFANFLNAHKIDEGYVGQISIILVCPKNSDHIDNRDLDRAAITIAPSLRVNIIEFTEDFEGLEGETIELQETISYLAHAKNITAQKIVIENG